MPPKKPSSSGSHTSPSSKSTGLTASAQSQTTSHSKSSSLSSPPPSSATHTTMPSKSLSSTTTSSINLPSRATPPQIAQHVWTQYLRTTPPRTLLLDAFMAFLVLVGGVQFLYAVVGGNYPFNAFLSGFCAAVGQFVLTASLRMQTAEKAPSTTTSKKGMSTGKTSGDGAATGVMDVKGGKGLSSERAFADYVFGSLILHGFCVNFIN